jgi:hypothetical protein
VSDPAPRLAPRSSAAAADFELLRVARTDLEEPETAATLTLADRIRGLSAFRALRPTDDGITGPGRRED